MKNPLQYPRERRCGKATDKINGNCPFLYLWLDEDLGRANYFVIFVENYLRKVWIYMMKCKGKWFERFKEFQESIEMQSKYTIKMFRWMSGGASILLHLKKCGVEGGLALHTCVCLEALHMRWFQMTSVTCSMQKKPNASFSNIVKM